MADFSRHAHQVAGDGEIWVDIALAKAPAIGGTVFTPAGATATGATLVVCGHNDWAQMHRPGRFQMANTRAPGALADDRGNFRLPARTGAKTVVVGHSEGFMTVPFADMSSNTLIRLRPWGRIEGVAQLAGRSMINEPIHLAGKPDPSTRISISFSPTTDANGRFVFDTVPPGTWKVQREINRPEDTQRTRVRMLQFSHGVWADVRSGETVTVVLGGTGHAVTGKAMASTSISPDVWTENAAALTQTDPPSEYRAMFKPDGSFRIEDVPSGEYTLKINLTQPASPSDGNRPNFKPFASLEKPVIVSADADVDLGLLELHLAN